MNVRHAPTVLLRTGAVAAVVAFALTGCTDGGSQRTEDGAAPSDARTHPSTAGTATSDAASPVPPTAPEPATTPIVIEVDGHQITGELDASATSASLVAQLPLTLSFSDFGGQEKLARLPAPLDLSGAPDRSAAPALTIGYYVPDQALILYYANVGSFSGIVPLGTYDSSDVLESQVDDLTVTLRTTE